MNKFCDRYLNKRYENLSKIEMGSIYSKVTSSKEQLDDKDSSDPKTEKKKGEEKPTKKDNDGDDDAVVKGGQVYFRLILPS